MRAIALIICFAATASSAQSETIVANRIIPANTVITANDIRIQPSDVGRNSVDLDAIIGMEARVALFAGREISQADVAVPAVVERNQIIQLVFQGNGLKIKTDGRALDRASPGDIVRVMNLASRSIVTALIDQYGVGYVSN